MAYSNSLISITPIISGLVNDFIDPRRRNVVFSDDIFVEFKFLNFSV